MEQTFEFNIGTRMGVIIASSASDFLSLLRSESQFWGTFNGSQRAGGIAQEFQSAAQNAINDGRFQSDIWPRAAQEYLNGVYGQQRYPLSDSEFGRFLETVYREQGPSIFDTIINLMSDRHTDITDRSKFRAAMLLTNFETGLSVDAPNAVLQALDKASVKFRKLIADARDELQQNRTQSEWMRNKFKWRRGALFRLVDRQSKSIGNRINESVNHTIEKLESTDRTFKDFMVLKAPVQYWESKAAEHVNAAENYQTALVKWGSGLGLTLLIILAAIFCIALEVHEQKPTLVLFLAAVGVFVTTVYIWIMRIMVRFFLSEHHLATDSKERAILITTYLALTAEKAADEKDRAIVLASIFRSTTDGIVKEDGAPDLSVASLLAKALSPK
jgi:hypothetical protein